MPPGLYRSMHPEGFHAFLAISDQANAYELRPIGMDQYWSSAYPHDPKDIEPLPVSCPKLLAGVKAALAAYADTFSFLD